ncbi:MAG: tetratricopeptide repeat protein [Elusimicrobia bacterium]|nr:tetratricopeptide repeat protein [Elusimicrobiota bacterium]
MGKASRRPRRDEPAPFPRASSPGRGLWIHAGLFAAILFIYAQVWYFDFVSYDDMFYLKMSPHVSNGLTWAGVKWAFTTFYFVNWHPVTWLSYLLDVEIYGRNAGGFHATNVALHAAASLLLFRLLRRLTDAELPSAFVAVLFAVHPMHVESVAWVAERKDVLSGLFLMLALSAYGAYARRPGLGRYLLTALLFALGLMSKPMLVTFPCLLLLLDVWPLRRWALPGDAPDPRHEPWGRLLAEKVPLLLLSAASSWITVRAQALNVAKLEVLPLSLRVANAASSYVAYAVKTIWPAKLAVFYPYPHVQSGWRMVACLLLLAAVSAAVLREVRRRPYLAVGWFWYLGTLVPVIGLVQTGDQSMADRYTYIPLIGLFIMAAWGGAEWAARSEERRAPSRAAALFALIALAIAARAQASHWRGDRELWTRALAVTQRNYVAESGIGTILLSEGKLEEAVEHYEKAAAYEPLFAQNYNTLGVTLMRFGHIDRALPYLEKAVKLSPGFAEAHSNLGLALAAKGRLGEAVAEYEVSQRLEPDYPEVKANLAIALARQGRLDEARSLLNAALRLNPDFVEAHYNLAVVLYQKGQIPDAVGHLKTALRLNPDHAEARLMLDDLTRAAPRP